MFFVIENVKGILSNKHFQTFMAMLDELQNAGYTMHYSLMNSMYYHIPQERYRVIVIGTRKDLQIDYHFPIPDKTHIINIRQAIGDINHSPNFYKQEKVSNNYSKWLNHDTYDGPFDAKFMARNRVRSWNEVSFTIQAQARNCPLHPQAPKMRYISRDKQIFVPGFEHLYRRLSGRECARIQTFPDQFKFIYDNVCDGYTMVGNAVPPRLGRAIASSLSDTFSKIKETTRHVLVATYKDNYHLKLIKEQHHYVRAGLRFGSIQFPTGMNAPDYLLLHKNGKRLLFRLKEECPQMVSVDKLREYGFLPSGDLYWLLKIKEDEELSKEEMELANL